MNQPKSRRLSVAAPRVSLVSVLAARHRPLAEQRVIVRLDGPAAHVLMKRHKASNYPLRASGR